jgi:hypothetical protein
MLRTPVDSSSVASVGYDPAACVLEVEFHGGGVYRYLDVPPQVHAELMAAKSIGRFVNLRVKPGFRYERG